MTDFPTFEKMADIDKAHGTLNVQGERVYVVDPRFRAHLESERVRILNNEAPATPAAPSLAGVTGTNALGQRSHLGGEPDSRMLELCKALAARVGPDGKRLVETEKGYREKVEASFAEAMGGARWGANAERMAAELADEAKNQAADQGYYLGIEKQDGVTFDRTDKRFQSAAALANKHNLSDKAFADFLLWQAADQGDEQ